MTTNHPDAPDTDAIAALLGRAEPRPVPPPDVEQAIRSSVHAEWQTVVQQKKGRTFRRRLAIAASLVVAVTAGLLTLNQPPVERIAVASVEKRLGTVTLRQDQADVRELPADSAIATGDVVETRRDAALGLSWHRGGSLRVDANTRLEFIDERTVYLHRGRLYFDSQDEVAPFEFVVQTSQGSLTHIGTRYMAAADDEQLVVTVREGRVRVDGRNRDETAGEGKQLSVRGSAPPAILNAPLFGASWSWIEAVSPGISLDNRTADDFLRWVADETGYDLEYADSATETLATETRLIGRVETDPRTELRLRMLTTDMDYELDTQNGVIRVRSEPSAVRQ